jgi:hypothetical protein
MIDNEQLKILFILSLIPRSQHRYDNQKLTNLQVTTGIRRI